MGNALYTKETFCPVKNHRLKVKTMMEISSMCSYCRREICYSELYSGCDMNHSLLLNSQPSTTSSGHKLLDGSPSGKIDNMPSSTCYQLCSDCINSLNWIIRSNKFGDNEKVEFWKRRHKYTCSKCLTVTQHNAKSCPENRLCTSSSTINYHVKKRILGNEPRVVFTDVNERSC